MKYNPFQPLYGMNPSSPKREKRETAKVSPKTDPQPLDVDKVRQELLRTKQSLSQIYHQVKKNNSTLSSIDASFLTKNKVVLIALLVILAVIVIIVYTQNKQKSKLERLTQKMQKFQKLKGS